LTYAPEGLLGYSMLAKPLRSQYWTLSAWKDSASLARFVREPPHREAMRELPNHLTGFRTVRWTSPGAALPPRWDDALSRMAGD